MRFLFWNVRGLGKSSRKQQVREFIEEHKLQMVGLQETMKESFTDRELLDIAGTKDFTWQWLPPKGKSGGILMGVCLETLELEDFSIHDFCIMMSVRIEDQILDGNSLLSMVPLNMIFQRLFWRS